MKPKIHLDPSDFYMVAAILGAIVVAVLLSGCNFGGGAPQCGIALNPGRADNSAELELADGDVAPCSILVGGMLVGVIKDGQSFEAQTGTFVTVVCQDGCAEFNLVAP